MLFLARYLTFDINYFLFYLKSLLASTLAGDYKFGSISIDVTLMITASIVRIGFHFSYNFY